MAITHSQPSSRGSSRSKLLERMKINPKNDPVQTRQVKTLGFGMMCQRKKKTKKHPTKEGLISENFREKKVSQCSHSLFYQQVEVNTSEGDLKGTKITPWRS